MLQNTIFTFLNNYIDKTRPVLLALSGGVDSMCLLHLLVKWQKETGSEVAIVHVDHGWRKESAQEAKSIVSLAKEHGFACYHTRLFPEQFQKNLELESRLARYQFFHEIVQQIGAQGVLLGHHKDDQVETVFKRLLEGSRMSYLSGMQPVSTNNGLVLLRPLLHTPKRSLLDYATAENISFFDDPTNKDTAFLRARMRESIFPFLRREFGKEFENNVAAISEEASLLRSYFDEKMKWVVEGCVESDLGFFFNVEKVELHPLEWMECMRVILEKTGSMLSRSQIGEAVSFLTQKSADKWLQVKDRFFYFDRGRLFVLFERSNRVEEINQLQIGPQTVGAYLIEVEEVAVAGVPSNHWLDLFKGKCVTYVPLDSYKVVKPHGQLYRKRSGTTPRNYFRCLSDYKVPRFFQTIAPLIEKEAFIYEDFLLGMAPVVENMPCLKVSLFRKVAVSR